MSMQSYPATGILLDLLSPEVQKKLNIEKECDEFLTVLETNATYSLSDFDASQIDFVTILSPEYRAFQEILTKFESQFNFRPETIHIDSEAEGCSDGVEPGHLYFSFDESDLWVKAPSPLLNSLKKVDAEPIPSAWTILA